MDTVRTARLAVLLAAAGVLSACSAALPPAASPTAPTTAVSSTAARTTAVARPSSRVATTHPTVVRPTTPKPTVTSTSAPAPVACPLPATGFDCNFQQRIVAVQAYIRSRPGTVGIVLRDRQTGAVWTNEYANTMVWTASTIKLAMTVDLYTRQRQGLLTLTATDRNEIQAMLHSSDDNAADALWFRYAGPGRQTYNARFPAYGMTSLQPQVSYSNGTPYWGFQECTPADLDRLIQYVLTELPADERNYIVGQLQSVDPDQQWGVWGAGPAAAPGNKDGWSEEASGWVLNSVGFVGPGQRYTLAIMNSLNGQGGYDDGTTTDSHVAQLLFTGRF